MELKKLPWRAIAVPMAVNVVMGFAIGGFAALLPLVREDFDLSRTEVGFYTTCLFLASFGSALLAGYLIDRLGIRKGLGLGGVVMGSFIALYGVVPSYYVLLIFAFGAGLGQSLLTPAGNKAIISLTGGVASNMIMGFFRSGVGVGSLIGAALLPWIALHLGWRAAIIGAGLICLILAINIFRNKSLASHDQVGEEEQGEKVSFKEEVKDLLTIPDFRFLVLTGFAFAAVLATLIGYLPLWLNEAGGLSVYHAGLGLGLAQAGGVAGRPFWGFLSDRFKLLRQDLIMAVQAVLMVITLITFAFAGTRLIMEALLALSFFIGFVGMGFGGVYFGFLGSLAGTIKTGVATGLALTFLRLAVVAIPPIFGSVADYFETYTWSWLFIAIFPALSLSYYIKVRVNKAKNEVHA